ncbi:facilitated trehalose transporter Tret1-like, partial [Venturia canescens]|uniref:facilitated trehalose transporter Tret1-like n=1 Tax=Venturia canescens TaxID=32260 RepID=UPI001C9D169B
MGAFAAQGFAALVATLATFSVGLMLSWITPSLPKFFHEASSVNYEDEIKVTPEEGSWIASMLFLATVFGPPLSMITVDRIGRKWSLGGIVVILLISWIITGWARTVELIDVGRFIGGLAVGAVFPLTAIYLGEIAEDRSRGIVSSALSVSMNAGQVLAVGAGPWVSRAMLSTISIIPLTVFIIAFPWIPETPYYWLIRGAREKAATSLIFLRQRSDVEKELAALESAVYQDQKNQHGFGATTLFRVRSSRRAFLIGIGLMTFQQLSGSQAIISYAGIILTTSGIPGWTNWSMFILGMFQLVAASGSLFLIDSLGRRPLLISSSLLTSIFIFLEAVFFHLQYLGCDMSLFRWVPLVGLVGFTVAIVPGLCGVPWLMINEIFSADTKAFASMLLGMYGSLLGFLLTKLYEPASSELG